MQVIFDMNSRFFLITDFLFSRHNIFYLFSGCRCPKGQLLQDGRCVPLEECRCGIPSGNGTLEFRPKDEVTVDCNTW